MIDPKLADYIRQDFDPIDEEDLNLYEFGTPNAALGLHRVKGKAAALKAAVRQCEAVYGERHEVAGMEIRVIGDWAGRPTTTVRKVE